MAYSHKKPGFWLLHFSLKTLSYQISIILRTGKMPVLQAQPANLIDTGD
jgi:hypothetical protein